MAEDFVHLHLHTEYSLLDGACRVDELVDQASKLGMKALAITDHGNMFGAVTFYDAAKAKGIKPIIGCEIYVAIGSRFDKNASGITEAYNHLTLLSTDDVGYHNLMKLVSVGYTEGFYHRPRIDKDILAQHSQGLVALSGCLSGEVAGYLRGGQEAQALKAVMAYADMFGPDRFYLELMDHGIEDQRQVNRALLRVRDKTNLPLVATNDAHYLKADDHEAHDILVCIGSGKKVQDAQRLNSIPRSSTSRARPRWDGCSRSSPTPSRTP
jgi:DNA polymerase III subunit alpha